MFSVFILCQLNFVTKEFALSKEKKKSIQQNKS